VNAFFLFTDPMTATSNSNSGTKPDMKLFWACFIALVATSFVFAVRANTLGQIQEALGLSEAQKGNISGAGMWPFALSIIFFSLVADRIGYKLVALFAITCHTISLLLTLRANSYESLYWATLLIAVANGTVEAFVNPVVATMFPREKAKWLNILHAGWPAGMALGALATVIFQSQSWQFKYGMCFVPLVIYAFLIIPRMFPLNERVAAGVSYLDMLREVGAVGFFILTALTVPAVSQMMNQEAPWGLVFGIAGAVALAVGFLTGSLGNWLFIFVLITIGPLATTELGTDGWMPELLKLSGPAGMSADQLVSFATWVFIYTSVVMTVLRFYAGPIVHKFSPIGLLVVGTIIAIAGLLFLSRATGSVIIAAATVYAFGKAFLWSTTLGMVSEQFPKGGALTLNGVSAVLFVGVLGAPAIGYQQDVILDQQLAKEQPALHQQIVGEPKGSIFGEAPSLNQEKVAALGAADQAVLTDAQAASKRGMFTAIAILPAFMLVCYLVMFLYFKSRGGYKPVAIHD
jgi:DHA2 family metal-tetracycline-proton antiporter-like MFS transporter